MMAHRNRLQKPEQGLRKRLINPTLTSKQMHRLIQTQYKKKQILRMKRKPVLLLRLQKQKRKKPPETTGIMTK